MAVDPEEEEEAEATQEVSQETGKFSLVPLIVNLSLISVTFLRSTFGINSEKINFSCERMKNT